MRGDSRSKCVAFLAVLLVALPAAAYRLEFIVQFRGALVPGAEVCFFPAGADSDDPVDYYLQATDVRCFPADSVIRIPAGRWLHYARHASRNLISSSPLLVTYDGPDSAPDIFGKNVIELEPAATLDLADASADLGPDESFAIYASNEGTEQLPMIFPVPRRETSVLVPASMQLIPLRREQRHIVAAGNPIRVAAAEHRKLDAVPTARTDGATLIAWTVFPQEVRTPEQPWRKVPAPDVTVVAADAVRLPILAPRAGFGSDGALMLFRNLPPGKLSLRAGGGIWSSDEIDIEVRANALSVAPRPLVIRPGATLQVRWTLRGTPSPSRRECGGETIATDPKPATVTLFRCPALQPGMTPDLIEPTACAVAAKPAVLDRSARRAAFDAVLPGMYLLTVSEPPFPPSRQVVELTMADVQSKEATLQAFRVFGRVMIDGAPVAARVEFASGFTFSDPSGHYDAALAGDPRDLPIHVRPCTDGAAVRTRMPEKPLIDNEPYDLVFVPNELAVRVLDDHSGAAVSGATVTIGVLRYGAADSGEFMANAPTTDPGGTATVRDLPTSLPLVVCAEATQYKRACSAPFTIGETARATRTIALSATLHEGVVAGVGPLRWGRVLFASPTGVVTESAFVQADGTFRFRQPHLAPEYAVVVSDQPLFIADLPAASEAPLTLRPPAAVVRNVEVRIQQEREQRDALVGLVIDGRYVPAMALSLHQGGRNLQPAIYGGGPLLITAILSSRSIQILLGPSPTDPLIDTLGTTDVFTLPAYRSTFPSRDAGADGQISF